MFPIGQQIPYEPNHLQPIAGKTGLVHTLNKFLAVGSMSKPLLEVVGGQLTFELERLRLKGPDTPMAVD